MIVLSTSTWNSFLCFSVPLFEAIFFLTVLPTWEQKWQHGVLSRLMPVWRASETWVPSVLPRRALISTSAQPEVTFCDNKKEIFLQNVCQKCVLQVFLWKETILDESIFFSYEMKHFLIWHTACQFWDG